MNLNSIPLNFNQITFSEPDIELLYNFFCWLGTSGCTILRVSSVVPILVEFGRLLVLQCVHTAAADVLRRHAVQAKTG